MRRATVTLTDELEQALDAYIEKQPVTPTLTAVVQAALRDFLAAQSSDDQPKKFWLTPAEIGSGDPHASRDHNRILADLFDARHAVDAFLDLKPGDTPPAPDLYVALLKFFARHGGRIPETPLRFRTIDDPDSDPWGSVEHDRYVADAHK